MLSSVSSNASSASTPAQPYAEADEAVTVGRGRARTIARITAFSPGQSPPPVSIPILATAPEVSRGEGRLDA